MARRTTIRGRWWSRRRPGAAGAAGPGGERRKPGVSLVEMALATPFMLLLMLGTVDLGRMFFDYIQLRGGAVEGATYGSRNPTDTAGITTQVMNNGVPADTAVGVSIDAACSTSNGVGNISVTASRTFTPITTNFLSQWGLGSVDLSATSTMRCLT